MTSQPWYEQRLIELSSKGLTINDALKEIILEAEERNKTASVKTVASPDTIKIYMKKPSFLNREVNVPTVS